MTDNTNRFIPGIQASARIHQSHRLRFALALLFLAATLALFPDLPGIKLRAAEKDEVAATVLAGMAANDRRLGGVRCDLVYTFTQSSDDSSATKETRKELPDGGVLIIGPRLNPGFRRRIFIDGDEVRTEFYGNADADRDKAEHIEQLADGVWKRFNAKQNEGSIQASEPDGPAASPFDPRQAGTTSPAQPYSRLLRETELASAVIESDAAGNTIARIQIRTESRLHEYEFAARYNFLPTRSVRYHADGKSINAQWDMTYQRVEPRQAWLLNTMTHRIIPEPGRKVADAPEPAHAAAGYTVAVEDVAALNGKNAIPEFKFHDGAIIQDHTASAVYQTPAIRPRVGHEQDTTATTVPAWLS